MYKIPLAEIKEKILRSNTISPDELDLQIKDKINELSGLISEEGAAHIIANELGVDLLSGREKLKIKELYAGMRNVTTAGKVTRKFAIREFARGDKMGKVGSLVIGDETGTIRVVFWNEQTEKLGDINDDDIILLKNGYIRENNGLKEVHVNEQTELQINPPGETITALRSDFSVERKKIAELQEAMGGAEIMATVVQVFDPRFFNICSQCGKKVAETEGSYQCAEHGAVKPALSYVLNLILDDGTSTIRGIFWRSQVQHLLQQSDEELSKFRDNPAAFESIKTDLLGEQLKLLGRVKRNELFDRLEFNVQLVEKANPEEEIARLEKIK